MVFKTLKFFSIKGTKGISKRSKKSALNVISHEKAEDDEKSGIAKAIEIGDKDLFKEQFLGASQDGSGTTQDLHSIKHADLVVEYREYRELADIATTFLQKASNMKDNKDVNSAAKDLKDTLEKVKEIVRTQRRQERLAIHDKNYITQFFKVLGRIGVAKQLKRYQNQLKSHVKPTHRDYEDLKKSLDNWTKMDAGKFKDFTKKLHQFEDEILFLFKKASESEKDAIVLQFSNKDFFKALSAFLSEAKEKKIDEDIFLELNKELANWYHLIDETETEERKETVSLDRLVEA